jgi:hypothetical protein
MSFHWESADRTTVVRCSTAATDIEGWYAQLARWVGAVDGLGGIGLASRQCEVDRGQFVTAGVPARYQGREFSIWSDEPGELVLVHNGLRAGKLEKLCMEMAAVWDKFDGSVPRPSAEQAATCDEHAVLPLVPGERQKLGIALHTLHLEPLNGLRHREAALTSGWYIWGGPELDQSPDFFDPLHHSHLLERCPQVARFLALPPGWRFLVAPGQVDIWFDASLLSEGIPRTPS